jgi:cation diffusion facilitator family transporter
MNSPSPVAGDSPVLDRWRQTKVPVPAAYAVAERRARLVLVLTLITMVAELIAGYMTGSLALMADGWHMGSHAAALGITTFAYIYAKRNASNDRFSFGTGKVSALAGYSSALLLGVVAFLVASESVERLIEPTSVDFKDALIVAVIGLVVNLTSAFVLGGGGHGHDHHGHSHGHAHAHGRGHGHGHGREPAPARARHDDHDHHAHDDHDHDAHGHDHSHSHDHDHDHHDHHAHDAKARAAAETGARSHVHLADHGHDHNLRAAYLHVVADALTSVLAIAALTAGAWLGWLWLDPLVAFAAALLIAWWAWGLLRGSGRVLLDAEDYGEMRSEITRILEIDTDNRVADVRVWSLGGTARAAIVAIVTHKPRSAAHYKRMIEHLPDLYHITIEVHVCDIDPCDLHKSLEATITGEKPA